MAGNGLLHSLREQRQRRCGRGAELTSKRQCERERERERGEEAEESEAMGPKRKTRIAAPTSGLSPRKTRSAAAGKRADPPPAKKSKRSSNGEAKRARGGKRKVKGATAKEVPDPEEAPASPMAEDEPAAAPSKTIIVEACKQCNSFKMRAIQVKEGLENAVPGIVVSINPDKPRRGCFEIREEGGRPFVSLLDLRRPFTPMRKLNMEDVIKGIVKKIT